MSTRAGIVVTGTEVLTGRVTDRNGPWLAERLREIGIDLAHIAIVGDRPEDVRGALRFMAAEHLDLVVTSGGLGPTADDLTAQVVGGFQGREMILDEALSGRIAEIVAPLMKRWPNIDPEAVEQANRKQATVPDGAEVLEPVGTAPGLVVTPASPPGPTVVVLPGPPRELQPMWEDARRSAGLRAVLERATVYRQETMRLFGIPESEIAETLRGAEREGVDLEAIEVTTCLKRGEVEIVTRYEPAQETVYEAFSAIVRERHGDTLFSEDGRTVDEIVADLLRARKGAAADAVALEVAVAESCTGGLMSARLTERPGSSDYFKGGIVVYSNEVKTSEAGVPAELIEEHGAVSQEVAEALARGAREILAADIGIGITGIAGPGGETMGKPVGLVWLSVAGPALDGGEPKLLTRSVNLPGGRADVRDRATTVALHLLRRSLLDN
ncbi:MAG TPA: competence/damage-inducible protein A [Solirubrobacteraceae bacterium]|nr:competence/damage-inducible protein A [Solirubrobacteraceae bacterium]